MSTENGSRKRVNEKEGVSGEVLMRKHVERQAMIGLVI